MLKNMKKSTKSNLITLGIVVGFYVLIQILGAVGALTNSFSGQLVPICAYVILAVSLNLTVGILGELSLGHAGFMSVGAFSGTLVYVVMSENAPQPLALLLAFVVGGAVAGLFGVLVGIPVLRLSGDYLAIVTLAFGEIVKNVMNACYLGVDSHGLHFSLKDSASLNLEVDGKVLINGAMGITGIKKASTFTIGIVLVIITLLVILNLVNSRAGRAIKAIRDNEIAARSVGVPITKYKLMAFVTSAVFAGVAGVLYALNYSSLVAKKFDYNTSILILVFVVLGGIGNLRGSVIAAAVLGFLIGIPVLRLNGDYLAIVTLAFGEIVKNVMNACYLGLDSHGLHFSLKDTASLNMEVDGKVLINGAMGITGIKKASTFAVGIVLVIITLLVILNLVNSRAGRAIKAIRDNEIAARSVGIPITKYKLMAFVTSAVFAGIAGVLYALNYSSLVAKKFDYNTSILILVFVVLGGIGNLRGSVIAAAVLTVLPELLRSMNDYRMLIYAIVLIVVMIFNQSPEMIALRKRLTARFRKEGADKKDAKEKKGVA